jgi:hypothetical protein
MKTLIPQIFDEIERAPTPQAKLQRLRAYDHPVLRGLLQLNFNPNFKLDLPEGVPPYKRDERVPIGYSETNLFAEFRRMYIWGKPSNLSKFKKEALFVQMLEGIHWTEADDLCLCKDKKLQTKYKTITEDLIREAFPDALPPPLPKEIKEEVKKEPKAKKEKVSLKG